MISHRTALSVNINKIATLRNSRGKNNPNVLQTALDLIAYGAHGITVHPRPDGRHIRYQDVYELAQHIDVELNIEGYPDQNFLALIQAVKPAQCTLVPDPPHVLTSNAGWSIASHADFLTQIVAQLHQYHIRTSLFIDPFAITDAEIAQLKIIGTDRVELYTEAYADSYHLTSMPEVLKIYQHVAKAVHAHGIELNAGHDLNLDNLHHFLTAIPMIKEVSIGHALICDALRFGLKNTVERYLALLPSVLQAAL